MAILDTIKAILGFAPAPTEVLNREATHSTPVVKRPVQALDPPAGLEITPEYTTAKQLIDAEVPLLFVTGKAGTGKSTFIQYLRNSLARRIVVLGEQGDAGG